jgi:hypothetical protein
MAYTTLMALNLWCDSAGDRSGVGSGDVGVGDGGCVGGDGDLGEGDGVGGQGWDGWGCCGGARDLGDDDLVGGAAVNGVLHADVDQVDARVDGVSGGEGDGEWGVIQGEVLPLLAVCGFGEVGDVGASQPRPSDAYQNAEGWRNGLGDGEVSGTDDPAGVGQQ